MRSGRTTLAATLLAVAVITFSIWFLNKYFGLEAHSLIARLWPPPTAEQIEKKQLHRIAGWFSLDCGHVGRRRENADRAIACAHKVLKAGRRFYVSFDYVGWDSHGTTGLAEDSKHEVYEVATDELGGGSLGWELNPQEPKHRRILSSSRTRCQQFRPICRELETPVFTQLLALWPNG
jgi:hypothetical protein